MGSHRIETTRCAIGIWMDSELDARTVDDARPFFMRGSNETS
jgi:hypothetical protein